MYVGIWGFFSLQGGGDVVFSPAVFKDDETSKPITVADLETYIFLRIWQELGSLQITMYVEEKLLDLTKTIETAM